LLLGPLLRRGRGPRGEGPREADRERELRLLPVPRQEARPGLAPLPERARREGPPLRPRRLLGEAPWEGRLDAQRRALRLRRQEGRRSRPLQRGGDEDRARAPGRG